MAAAAAVIRKVMVAAIEVVVGGVLEAVAIMAVIVTSAKMETETKAEAAASSKVVRANVMLLVDDIAVGSLAPWGQRWHTRLLQWWWTWHRQVAELEVGVESVTVEEVAVEVAILVVVRWR